MFDGTYTCDGAQTAELVRRATRGDQPSIDELIGRHLDGLRAFVRVQAGPAVRAKESCSDLVQSVCREILSDLDEFEYRGDAAFRSYLFQAALRKIIDRQRFWQQEKRDARREVPAQAAGESHLDQIAAVYRTVATPSRAAIAKEEVERVEAAFDALPDDYRKVVVMSRILGLPHKEIAQQMDRTEVATRHLLSRALARLASVLDT